MAETDDTTAAQRRTGQMLRRARGLAGYNERKAARALGIDRHRLRAWEAGAETPDATDLERAVRLYGAELDQVWPDRQPLVRPEHPGMLVVGTEMVATDGDNRTILARYLTAVRRQRGLRPDDPIELRADDIAGLAHVLDLDDDDLEAALADLLGLTPAGARYTVRALVVGALMAIGATSLVAGGWLVDQPDVAASGTTTTTPVTSTTEAPEAPGDRVDEVVTTPHGATISVEAVTVEAPGHSEADTGAEGAAPAVAMPERSPFSTEPSSVAVELAPAVFAVAPATEWTPRPTELFGTHPTDATPVAPAEPAGTAPDPAVTAPELSAAPAPALGAPTVEISELPPG